MSERVNSVDETCVIKSKDGENWLCRLIHVTELEKRKIDRVGIVSFTEKERDDFLSKTMKKLKRQGLEPDFYFENWPQTTTYGKDAFLVQPPIIYLKIEFYKKLSPVNVERPRMG